MAAGTEAPSAEPEITVLGLPFESPSVSGPPVLELLLLTTANLLCLVAMHWRKKTDVLRFLPEQLVSIMMGMLLGGVTLAAGNDDLSETILYNFSSVFFDFLLPAIIFANSFSVKNKSFFRNLSGILCFSLLGTAISSVVIGIGVYGAFQSHLVHPPPSVASDSGLVLSEHGVHPGGSNMPLVDCLILGALLSAVDPGAVLSVLPATVDRQIYAFLFGESVLNSAVAVVLYNSFRVYHAVLEARGDMDRIERADLWLLVNRFAVITVTSMAAGVTVGLLSALTLKRVVKLHDSPGREQALILLFAYLGYLIPREAGLSPVVALFFCGATMTHYTYYNLSTMSQIATSSWFKSLGHVAETFVFVFLGASVFSVKETEWHVPLICALVVLCLLSRVLQITVLSSLINLAKYIASHSASWSRWLPCRIASWCTSACFPRHDDTAWDAHRPYGGGGGGGGGGGNGFAAPAFRPPPDYISVNAQIFLSLSGLRGAVAFALALHDPVLNQEGQMVTTTISVILFTYVIQGSLLQWVARYLGLVGEEGTHLRFHEQQRRRNMHELESPREILRLGMSPDTAHMGANVSAACANPPATKNAWRSFSFSEDGGEQRYGTFAQAWRRFDEGVMKPIFGGRVRNQSRYDAVETTPLRFQQPSLEGLVAGPDGEENGFPGEVVL